MRVLPINSFNKLSIIKNNTRTEQPPIVSIPNTDTVNFRGNYEKTFQKALSEPLKTVSECLTLYKELLKTAASGNISKNADYFLKQSFNFLRDIRNSSLNETLITSATTQRVLLKLDNGAMKFFNPNGKGLPISFWAGSKDLYMSRPGNKYNYEDLTWETLTFRPGLFSLEIENVDFSKPDWKGYIKERELATTNGIIERTYYDKYGKEDFWKNLLLP